MLQVSADEARAQLDALLTAAFRGEAIFISQDSEHIVQLVPISHTGHTWVAGSGKGKFTSSNDCDVPLADFDWER